MRALQRLPLVVSDPWRCQGRGNMHRLSKQQTTPLPRLQSSSNLHFLPIARLLLLLLRMTILLLLLLPSSLLATQIGFAASLGNPSPLLGPLSNFLASAEHQSGPIGPSLPEFYQSPPSFYRDTESTGSDEPYVPSQQYIEPEPYVSSDTHALPEVMPSSDFSGQVDYFYGDQDPVYDRQQAQSGLSDDLGFEGAQCTPIFL